MRTAVSFSKSNGVCVTTDERENGRTRRLEAAGVRVFPTQTFIRELHTSMSRPPPSSQPPLLRRADFLGAPGSPRPWRTRARKSIDEKGSYACAQDLSKNDVDCLETASVMSHLLEALPLLLPLPSAPPAVSAGPTLSPSAPLGPPSAGVMSPFGPSSLLLRSLFF